MLLAAYAAESGFAVTFGDQRIIASSLHKLPAGIYFDKSVSRTKITHYKRLKAMGFSIAAVCEEGLVYRDKAAYQFERISPQAMELLDAFFAWGKVHRDDILEVVPEAEHKVYAHGNPRFDLLREPFRAILVKESQELAKRHGPYILVATTLSRFNMHEGREDILGVLRARGFVLTPDQEAFYRRLIDHLGQVFHGFQAMVPELAKAFPDHTVILRPHPSENHERWQEVISGLDNARVLYEGSIEPWILGADAVIHNASTVGIEAYLLDHPVLSFMPVVDPIYNRLSHLPNFLSERPRSTEDLIEKVRQICSGKLPGKGRNKEKRDVALRNIANASGPFACELIVRALSELHNGNTLVNPRRWQVRAARLQFAARNLAVSVNRLLRVRSSLTAYMDQKFPGLTFDEVQSVLSNISRVRGKRPALKLRAHPILPSCFLITSG